MKNKLILPGISREIITKLTAYFKVVKKTVILMFLFLAAYHSASAQDPGLPPTNLGLANVYDGIAGKPGFVYQAYAQYFQTHRLNDGTGAKVPTTLKVNSLLQMNQLIYLSPVHVFGGNLGFTILVPIVQINASDLSTHTPSVNPGVLGDIIQGTAIQWSNRKLFGKAFSHRIELDINLPVGNYDSQYAINASSHLWAYSAYHAFTIMLNDKSSVSARNQLNYNASFIGSKAKAGAYYNGNYAVDYSIITGLKIEAVAYYLAQFNQDSYDGDSNYYRNEYKLDNTKERVLGYGPGLAYFSPNGVLIEAKVFFETGARNRFEGNRPTLRLAIPLAK